MFDQTVMLKAELYDAAQRDEENRKFVLQLANVLAVSPDEQNQLSYESLLERAKFLMDEVYGNKEKQEKKVCDPT